MVDVPVIMQPAFLQSALVPQVKFLDRVLDFHLYATMATHSAKLRRRPWRIRWLWVTSLR